MWTVFDTGALTAHVTTPGVPAMSCPGIPNIVSPVKVRTTVPVDLECIAITIGDSSMQDKTWSGTLPAYTLDGRPVQLTLPADAITLSIPAGFYIVAARKIEL